MSDLQSADVGETGQQSALPGVTLHKARLDKGLTVAEVAARLNLTESAVNSLEADRYEDLPGITFVRGYIRAYAKLVELDADQLARQYSQTTTTAPVRPLQVLTPERKRGRSRFMLIGLVLFIIAIAVAAYITLEEQGRKRLGEPEQAALLSRVEVERADGTLHVQSLDDLDAQTASMPIAEITLDAKFAADEDTQEPVEAEQQITAAPEQQAEQPAAPAETPEQQIVQTNSSLQLIFVEECWVRVTDASGAELASGLKPAGSELILDGEAPYELHLGNAPGLRIFFKGQEVDFKDSIRGNVARLKLG